MDNQDHALEELAEARSYTLRTLKMFRGHLFSPVLEVGAGTGNITLELLGHGHKVTASELSQERLNRLKSRALPLGFSQNLNTAILDLNKIDDETKRQLGQHRSIVAFNVVEHIKDHDRCLRGLYDLLEPGGTLCVVVPAHAWLYGPFDRAIGHYRRYTRETLSRALRGAGFEVEKLRYFNSIAVFGWFLNFRVLARDRLPGGQLKIFDRLSPLLALEDYVELPFGLSVLAVGRRPASR